MSGLKFYLVDCETVGLDSSYHEMTEISLIDCDTRVQLTEFIKCDYPERANIDSLKITNKTLADLENGNSREYVVNKINKFLNEDGLTPAHRCLIGHNSQFDRKFIWALYEKVGQQLPVDLWICTMALTRAYAKKIGLVKPKVNLTASLEIVGIKKLAGAHASKVDTRNTFLLWKNLTEEKNIDYLPFVKTIQHQVKESSDEEQGLDPDLLDL